MDNLFRCLIFVFLLGGFAAIILVLIKRNDLKRILFMTKSGIDEKNRQRVLASRYRILAFKENKGILNALERDLYYSGIKFRFPRLNAELILFIDMLLLIGIPGYTFLFSLQISLLLPLCVIVLEFAVLKVMILISYKRVEKDLMEFLNYIASFGTSLGDFSAVLRKVAPLMRNPLQNAIYECLNEIGITGDAGTALIILADRVKHPQFKEIVRNIEVSIRYSADFENMVKTLKKNTAEYLDASDKRKVIVLESMINMVVLSILCIVVLFTINGLFKADIGTIILYTIPGRVGIGIYALAIALFISEVITA